MWHNWLQVRPSRKPQYWWTQIEREEQAALPFAHLFPNPPPGRGPLPDPSLQLVRELGRQWAEQRRQLYPPQDLASVVEASASALGARRGAPPRIPANAQQQASRQWGPDGALVEAWFEQGESLPLTLPAPPAPRGLRRLVAF